MKITQGFDVNQDGKNDIYITRDMPDAKTGCWMMLVVAAAFVVAAVLFSDGCRNFRAIYIENIKRALRWTPVFGRLDKV